MNSAEIHMLTIKANVDNKKISDKDFRDMVRTITDLFEEKTAEYKPAKKSSLDFGPYGYGVSQDDR